MQTEPKPKENRQQKEPKTLVLTRKEELVRRIKPESSSSRQQRLGNKRHCICWIIKTWSCLSKLVTLVLLRTIVAITVITAHGTWRCWRRSGGGSWRRSGIAIASASASACLPKRHFAKTKLSFHSLLKRWKIWIDIFRGDFCTLVIFSFFTIRRRRVLVVTIIKLVCHVYPVTIWKYIIFFILNTF